MVWGLGVVCMVRNWKWSSLTESPLYYIRAPRWVQPRMDPKRRRASRACTQSRTLTACFLGAQSFGKVHVRIEELWEEVRMRGARLESLDRGADAETTLPSVRLRAKSVLPRNSLFRRSLSTSFPVLEIGLRLRPRRSSTPSGLMYCGDFGAVWRGLC